MKLKTVTLLALIGAVVSICLTLSYTLMNTGVFTWSLTFSVISNLLALFSNVTIALFFYTLYKNQK